MFWSLATGDRINYRNKINALIGYVPRPLLQPTPDDCRVIAEARRKLKEGIPIEVRLTFPNAACGDSFRAAKLKENKRDK